MEASNQSFWHNFVNGFKEIMRAAPDVYPNFLLFCVRPSTNRQRQL
jgi:hypothetical protein